MRVNIPFFDLKKQYSSIQHEIDAKISQTLYSGHFILGQETAAFEKEFAAFCGVNFAVGVDSGTSAIQLALLAARIGAGDEVITVSHTAVATVAAIELTGAKPVLVDIDPSRYTLDAANLKHVLTGKTRAIIPVHLYGCPTDMAPILAFAKEYNLLVIEDCAQAHGARYDDIPVGGLGDLSAFSFYPTKNLGAYGDGGAILTNSAELADRLNRLRQYGWNNNRISEEKGVNARLDEIQSAILRIKLRHLREWNERRRFIAGMYNALLAASELILPVEPPNCRHVYHQYVIRHSKRDELRDFLSTQGIQTQIHYPVPVHLQPGYKELGMRPGSLPKTENAANEILSLPIYPELMDEQVEYICNAILKYLN